MLFLTAPLSGIAAAITIAAASPAVGLYQNAPVSVVSCDQSNYDVPMQLDTPVAPIRYGNLHITFVNHADLKATNVRFAVTTPDGVQTVSDAGTFSTGARISHNFSPAGSANFADATKCAVQSVTFSDGSTWQS